MDATNVDDHHGAHLAAPCRGDQVVQGGAAVPGPRDTLVHELQRL